MKDSTKAKIRQTWGKVMGAVVPFFVGATIGAEWCGYVGAIVNDKNIDRLQKQVNHNATCSQFDRSRIEKLEADNDLLMKKALNVTEGKEESAA